MTALVDDEGVDITFKLRDGTRTLDVQVKGRFLDESKILRDKGIVLADTREVTFRPRKDLYMLFAVVNGSRAEFGPVWLVPSTALDEDGFRVRINAKTNVRFQASAKSGSKDKWRAYRMSREELAGALIAVLRQLEPEGNE